MSGSGFSNSELGSRSRVKHLHHASRNSQTLFPNEVESRSHTEKDVLMCVFVRALTLTKAHARRMETNIKRMWGGGAHFDFLILRLRLLCRGGRVGAEMKAKHIPAECTHTFIHGNGHMGSICFPLPWKRLQLYSRARWRWPMSACISSRRPS